MSYSVALDSTSTKYLCPGCGHKTFVAYCFSSSGKPVDEKQFGRCDRQNNCGHHTHPGKAAQDTEDQEPTALEPATTCTDSYRGSQVL